MDFEKGVSVLDIGCGSGIWIKVSANYPTIDAKVNMDNGIPHRT